MPAAETSGKQQGSLLAFGFKRARQPLADRHDAVAVNNAPAAATKPAPKPVPQPAAAAGGVSKRPLSIAAGARKLAEREERLRLAWERRDREREEKEQQRRIREQSKIAKVEDKEREKAEKLKKREEEKAERERKRLEAIEAKRYPIEDTQLMEELVAKGAQMKELKLPEFGAKEDGAQMARLLFVADVTQRFPKELGIKPLSMETLQAALEGKKTASSCKTKNDELEGFELVSQLYQGLLATTMEDLVNAGVASRMERRWNNLLDAGTWPEILRRYILLSHKIAQEEEDVVQLVDDETAGAARDLSRSPPEDLTVSQHLMLLENLCNEALATSELRTALAKRVEEAEDVLRDLRAERQEDRKQIREVEAALKEERKLRREEEAAKKAELQAQIEAASGAAAAAGPEGAAGAKVSDKAVALALSAYLNEGEDQEPTWELPADLQEFTGDSDDRKALLEWRQRVQAEKQRLEKEKLHWQGEKRRRDREREKQNKAEMDARKAKQKELERLQDVLGEKEEAYERELNKYIVRQDPMGLDRYHRRYWWGIGGARGTVYIEADDGCWAKLTTVDELEELLDSLDKRGVREAELIESFDKYYHAIAKAMKRAAGEAERLKKAEEKPTATVVAATRILPRRGASRGPKATEEPPEQTSRTPASVEQMAAHVVLDRVTDLVQLAKECRAKVPPAAESFDKLRAKLEASVDGADAQSHMCEALFLLEEAFFGLSGQPEAETSDEEESEKESQQAPSGLGRGSRMPRSRSAVSIASCTSTDKSGKKGSKGSVDDDEVEEYVYESDDNGNERPGHEAWRTAKKKTWLYRDIKERKSWISALEKAPRLPCVAYGAGCLLEAVEALIEALEGRKRKIDGAGSKSANKKARN